MSCAATILLKKRTDKVGSHRAHQHSSHKRDDASPLTHIHQAAGNLAFKSLLQSHGIRGKAAVSKPDDPLEREADRMADHVLSDQSAAVVGPGSQQTLVQKRGGSVPSTIAARSGRPMSGFGTGQPLDHTSLDFMESRLGHDFESVRIHTDSVAAASARALNANAFTVGRDIVFAAGQYDPASTAGRRLLSHELAHVVQQDGGPGSNGQASTATIQRQMPNAPKGDTSEPAVPTDATSDVTEDPATAAPPPEHAERVAWLEEMASGIESESAERDALQTQYRSVPERSDDETEAQRRDLKARLTEVEKRLETSLEEHIALIDEAIKGLEAVLPGFTPGPPVAPTSTPAADPGGGTAYTVQSELYRLAKDKRDDQAHLLLIKRCLARKRIREIEAEIPTLPAVGTGERETLLKEKAEAVEYLKSTASNVSCIKPSSQTVHPTEVSPGQLEKIKIGEGWVPTAYVALEGQKKESGGCTIGYGHVITSKESSCAHGPKPPELDDPTVKVKPPWPCVCDNADWQSIDRPRGEEILKSDLRVQTNWIKEHVLVDLDQGQFDALVDIAAHVGSVPNSLIDIIHKKICTDDEAVRQAYMKTALFTKDRPELGPVFAKRRKERVWAPKSDDDPGCI